MGAESGSADSFDPQRQRATLRGTRRPHEGQTRLKDWLSGMHRVHTVWRGETHSYQVSAAIGRPDSPQEPPSLT